MTPDREDVVSHMQIMHTWAEFALEHEIDFFEMAHIKRIAEWTEDALALLKEQEPVKPHTFYHGIDAHYTYRCGYCNLTISEGDNYCTHCGKAVKWE